MFTPICFFYFYYYSHSPQTPIWLCNGSASPMCLHLFRFVCTFISSIRFVFTLAFAFATLVTRSEWANAIHTKPVYALNTWRAIARNSPNVFEICLWGIICAFVFTFWNCTLNSIPISLDRAPMSAARNLKVCWIIWCLWIEKTIKPLIEIYIIHVDGFLTQVAIISTKLNRWKCDWHHSLAFAFKWI